MDIDFGGRAVQPSTMGSVCEVSAVSVEDRTRCSWGGQDCAGMGWVLMSPSTQDYLLKIIDTPGLLKPEQVSALFGNIENIYALNRYGMGLTHSMFCL